MPTLAYCLPLIHPAATLAWQGNCQRLLETVGSLINASGPNAGIFIGTNRGAPLPPLPQCVHTIPLDLPPPATPVFVEHASSEQVWREAVRLDKGLKVLAAIGEARAQGYDYVMIVDADDLVSRRVPAWVKQHAGQPGWYVRHGWLHPIGSRWIYREPAFHERCGTCFIVRIDVLDIPSAHLSMPEHEIRVRFGSHKFLLSILDSRGTPLAPLPFPGSVYRVGHENNISGTGSLKAMYFQKYMLRQRPFRFMKNLMHLRPLTNRFRNEFGC